MASGLAQSLQVQARVLKALVVREMLTRFGRANIGIAWLFVEPMLFTAAITSLWAAVGLSHVPREHVIAFAITGYSTVLLWRNAASRCVHAIEVNIGLLYHKDITVTDVLIARVILEVAGATASFMILTAAMVFIGIMNLPQDLLYLTVAWVLMAWFGAGLALVIGSLAEKSDFVERLWQPTSYILFVLSGTLYMVDWLPEVGQRAVLWIPMVHGTEAIRHAYFGDHLVQTHENLSYLLIANLVLTLLGLMLSRIVNSEVELS